MSDRLSEEEREKTLQEGRRTLRIETEALESLSPRLGIEFIRAVEIIHACRGKVIVTGIGKSGHICKKIAATLTSTGTPAIFLHSAEAVHGDLGMLSRDDTVVAISYSGETEEIHRLIPAVTRLGLPLITLTGDPESTLAGESDVVLDVSVKEEACSLGLAPTASTTAALAMGDALAVALHRLKGLLEEDFAQIHPGGRLGRRWLKVGELMHTGSQLPCVPEDTVLKDAIFEISSKGLGVTAIVDGKGVLSGVITDGDLRRMIETNVDFYSTRVSEVMTRDPKGIDPDDLAARAVQVMESHSITSLVITDAEGRPTGIIHLHDLLKAGVV